MREEELKLVMDELNNSDLSEEEIEAKVASLSDEDLTILIVQHLIDEGVPSTSARRIFDIAIHANDVGRKAALDACEVLEDYKEEATAKALALTFFEEDVTQGHSTLTRCLDLWKLQSVLEMAKGATENSSQGS